MTAHAQRLAAHVFDVDRRHRARADVAIDTAMIDREGAHFAVRILNLSETGFMAVTVHSLCERAPVRIDVPGIGWCRADIIWALGARIGGRFRAPIDPAAFTDFAEQAAASTV